MNSPTINTRNCVLTTPGNSHASLLCDFYNNNRKNLEPWEPKRNADFYTHRYWKSYIQTSIQLFKDKQAVKLIALNKEQTQIIGICNFSNIVFGCFEACHLGYCVDKNHEGKGIMFEIIRAGINYMREEFQLHRIMANHMPNNYRSEELLKKMGFEREGYAKDYLKINGKWQDHILNSLILPSK